MTPEEHRKAWRDADSAEIFLVIRILIFLCCTPMISAVFTYAVLWLAGSIP